MPNFTPTQGRYLSFILAYIRLHGRPPAESEIGIAMHVSPPSVNQMVKTLEKRGLILRQPGQARSIQILISESEIPIWGVSNTTPSTHQPSIRPEHPLASPVTLYVVKSFLKNGPASAKIANKEVSRVIEIRSDQTLDQLHRALFIAHDRHNEKPYEFQFGKYSYDPEGPNYRPEPQTENKKAKYDACTTTLEELELNRDKVFGYRFDFHDNWFHQIQIDRIEVAIPTVTYPRVIKKVGKSPQQ